MLKASNLSAYEGKLWNLYLWQ